jgi:hypothetical protein
MGARFKQCLQVTVAPALLPVLGTPLQFPQGPEGATDRTSGVRSVNAETLGSSWRVSLRPRIFRVPDPSPLRVGILTFPIPANRAQRPDPRTRRVGHPKNRRALAKSIIRHTVSSAPARKSLWVAASAATYATERSAFLLRRIFREPSMFDYPEQRFSRRSA